MKRWLTIFVFLLTAAIALADSTHHDASPKAILPTAVLSQDNGHATEAEAAPMLAIPGQAPMHFCGTEQAAGKGSRPGGETLSDSTLSHTICAQAYFPKAIAAIEGTCLIAIRSTERYIYFLRRIVI